MFTRLRPAALLCALVIGAAACGGGSATTAPAATTAAAATTAPAASAGATAAPTPSVACDQATPSSPAPAGIATNLSGTLTVWEGYGASGKAERDAFCTMVANVKAVNPGLTVNVLDYPFNNLFTQLRDRRPRPAAGPDLYIAPNDSLPTEARANLLKDLSSIAGTSRPPHTTSATRPSPPTPSTASSTRSPSR